MADEKNTIDPALDALMKLRDACAERGLQIEHVSSAGPAYEERLGDSPLLTGARLAVVIYAPSMSG